ncbi:MAG: general stress protein [Chroococcidiopsidaceae cyanobacterium CP_BM_ER_R8_30]|nr:general stress protein [Chroococcidiopsidaceae cyanobacterium CP_BM_ER_R8_30]
MTLGLDQRAVGVFSSRRDAEYALQELRDAGFSMDKVSVVAKDADRTDNIAGADVSKRVGNKADEGAGYGAAAGGTLGGIGGLLVGLGTLAIPGIGPIMLAGAAATTLATTAAGAGIGAAAGGLIGALVGLGIPEGRARVYNERVSQGDYLVIVDGTENEIRQAEAILQRQGIQEWGIYDAPNADTTRANYGTTGTPGVDTTTRTEYPGSVTYSDSEVTIIDHREPNI